MKKSIHSLIILVTIAATINNSTHGAFPRAQKLQANDKKAIQLTKNIRTKMESAKKASTPAEKQQIQYELKNDIEQATTYFDSVQNFFGYGPIAEKRRAQAEQQKAALEQKLFLEKKRFKTLLTDAEKEKSLKIQNKLANQIHTEKITLGQAWSLKQKALAAALTGATAYVGYQYGGQAVSAAKKWFGDKMPKPGEPTDAEMMAVFPTSPRERLWPRSLNDITVEDYIEGGTSDTLNPANTATQISKGLGEWAQDQAYYFYNLLPSLRSTTTNE